ncbi:class I SAM-dependent methyltransferase [Rubinisphaera margarita]|uniref:class I SAM-dependent methyltransferase n=1 Tax=Rubinisphaera margarita TaxID=2909586 RepID=UPI001EE852DF|nr:class I SAM-dependent methyltransferase [Rubinisphaera margarita]MCG6157942.1 class I SAM-dependent methyltransferase [Rubinisphaera margarita]
MVKLKKDYASFRTRPARTQYLHDQFGSVLKGKILDVGCYEAPLREMLPNEDYLGIDIVGKPDQVVDLEKAESLPFRDGSFNCVICIEVLEHLNNLHDMYQELFRVSSSDVIVSLPNCWCGARQKVGRGNGEILHYGLPHKKPVDRHKWFFNVTQVAEFFSAACPAEYELVDVRVVEKPRSKALQLLRKFWFSTKAYDNRYAHTVFGVYRRRQAQKLAA